MSSLDASAFDVVAIRRGTLLLRFAVGNIDQTATADRGVPGATTTQGTSKLRLKSKAWRWQKRSSKEWERLLLAGRQVPLDLPKELRDLLHELNRVPTTEKAEGSE
jgi:hypothetical protein